MPRHQLACIVKRRSDGQSRCQASHGNSALGSGQDVFCSCSLADETDCTICLCFGGCGSQGSQSSSADMEIPIQSPFQLGTTSMQRDRSREQRSAQINRPTAQRCGIASVQASLSRGAMRDSSPTCRLFGPIPTPSLEISLSSRLCLSPTCFKSHLPGKCP